MEFNIDLIACLLKVTPEIIQAILSIEQQIALHTKTKKDQRTACLYIFKSIFQALDSVEQELLVELLEKKEVTKDFADIYMEDPTLRTHVFESIVNRKWKEKFSKEEEIAAGQLPIQVRRHMTQHGFSYQIESYTFSIHSDIQKVWKKLYKKIKHKII